MTIDASALIELASLVVTIVGAAFGTGVAVGKLLGKVLISTLCAPASVRLNVHVSCIA